MDVGLEAADEPVAEPEPLEPPLATLKVDDTTAEVADNEAVAVPVSGHVMLDAAYEGHGIVRTDVKVCGSQ